MSHYRILALVAILTSILFLPYWVYVPLLFASIIIFRLFWEGIIFSFLIDVLYSGEALTFLTLFHSFAFWSLVVLMFLVPIRTRIRNYA